MTRTIVSSANREVVIGFDEPFCIIGERINPTGRKLLMAEMAAGDYSRVERDALAQVAAGAHMLDVNAGVPLADEPKILADCIRLVQSLVDVPLSIDSSIVAALEAGLEVYQGKPLLNSVTGTIDNFTLSGGEAQDWSVNLAKGAITVAAGTAAGMAEGGGVSGSYSATFHGSTDDGNGNATVQPSAVTGEFNANMSNGSVAGAFGANKE